MAKKFKSIEKNAKNLPTGKVEDLQWEGEEVQAQSETKLESDQGTGRAVVLRFFDFGANVEAFKAHKPTAQELFNSHIRGIEAQLWRDGLTFFKEVEPRLIFAKNKMKYRFIIAAVPNVMNTMADKPKTLSQLLA